MKTTTLKRIMLGALAIGIFLIAPTSCKKDKIRGCTDPTSLNYNSQAEEDDGTCTYANPIVPGPGTSTTDLKVLSVTTGPTMDGAIDASWANCQKLTGNAVVPNISDFPYFTGESYSFTLRAQRDATNIYILAEWTDPAKSLDRESWYFNPTTKLWVQQNKIATSTSDKFYEDKFAFLWPTPSTEINNWNNSTCYSTCHGVSGAAGYNTATKHYAGAGEVVDMWHWKSVRTGPYNLLDDQRIIAIADVNNPTATEKKDGGRGSDTKTSGGYIDNKQTLMITGTTTSVSVPKYVIPNQTGMYWYLPSDISGGSAKLVTAVDANGVLTYAGGTLDPTGDAGYAAGTGAKRFPSVYLDGPFVGSRGDITTYANHTGTVWVVEIKRALTTTDTANDVQFDITKEYMFGFAIFENAAIAHGIKPGLKLKF